MCGGERRTGDSVCVLNTRNGVAHAASVAMDSGFAGLSVAAGETFAAIVIEAAHAVTACGGEQ